jgi:ankyrin repeat protein
LIDAGVNVNGDDASGTTPLMMARSAEVARLLIAAGANVQMPNVNGVGALQMSIWREPELTRVLLRAGAVADDPSHQSPLFLAACAGNADAVQVLLQAGAVPDRYDVHSGKTPRQCAESASQVRDPEPLFENVKPPFEKNFARVIALLDRATAKRK